MTALPTAVYRAAAHVLSEDIVPSSDALAEWKLALNTDEDLPTDRVALAKIFVANVSTYAAAVNNVDLT